MPNQNLNALSAAAQAVLPTVIDRELFCVAYYPECLTDLPTAPLSDVKWNGLLGGLSADGEERFRDQLLRWKKLRKEANEMPTRTDQTAPLPPLQPPSRGLRPGAPYDPSLHIPNPAFESQIHRKLVNGEDVSLIGGDAQGKTWWAHHFLYTLRTQRRDAKAIYVDLARNGDFDLSTSVYPWLRTELIRQLRVTESESKRCPEAPRRLVEVGELVRAYFERPECAHHKVVLAFDGISRLMRRQSGAQFHDHLRALLDQSMENRSVLLLLDEEIPLVKGDRSRLPTPGLVPDYPRGQLNRLAQQYDLELTPEDAHRLWRLLGGHPYLCRMAMYRKQQGSVSTDSWLEDAACAKDGGPAFQEHLSKIRTQLTEQQLDGLRTVYENAGSGCTGEVLALLLRRNLILRNELSGKHHLHCRLYLHLLRP